MNTLALKNAHPRDKRIEFFEGPHLYVVDKDPSKKYISVTTFNGHHFEEYSVESHALSITKSRPYRNDPRYEFYKKPVEEIVRVLKAQSEQASAAGTGMHYELECYWNGAEMEKAKQFKKELEMFHQFVEKHTTDLEPFFTEKMIFTEKYRLAGSVDMIFRRSDGKFLIYDWKRCKKLDNTFTEKFATTECIRHMPDTKVFSIVIYNTVVLKLFLQISHYTLQLNTYKRILETEYGYEVAGLFLVGLHPDQKTFLHIEIPFIPDEIDALFALRAEQIKAEENEESELEKKRKGTENEESEPVKKRKGER